MTGQSDVMSLVKCDVLVVGGGPAGLRAAELVSAAGLRTVLADRMPSVGRKFLVAGRGGLNLTHSEPVERFPRAMAIRAGTGRSCSPTFRRTISAPGPKTWASRPSWARATASSRQTSRPHRCCAVGSSKRLRKQGVPLSVPGMSSQDSGAMKMAISKSRLRRPKARSCYRPARSFWLSAVRHGRKRDPDGGWVKPLCRSGHSHDSTSPRPTADMRGRLDAQFLTEAEGLPLKNIVVRAGDESVAGDQLITKYGIEGGAIYQLGRALREMSKPEIEIDLKPAFTTEQLAAKIRHAKGAALFGQAAQAWRLNRVARALLYVPCAPLRFSQRTLPGLTKASARFVCAARVQLRKPFPLREAWLGTNSTIT